VENINSNDLNTIRSYPKPPDNVFLAMKPIYYMITKTVPAKGKEVAWADIRSFMMKDFIRQVQ